MASYQTAACQIMDHSPQKKIWLVKKDNTELTLKEMCNWRYKSSLKVFVFPKRGVSVCIFITAF